MFTGRSEAALLLRMKALPYGAEPAPSMATLPRRVAALRLCLSGERASALRGCLQVWADVERQLNLEPAAAANFSIFLLGV